MNIFLRGCTMPLYNKKPPHKIQYLNKKNLSTIDVYDKNEIINKYLGIKDNSFIFNNWKKYIVENTIEPAVSESTYIFSRN